MKPAAFRYRRARDADEAVALAAEAGEDARFLAGGQSLVPMMNFRVARPAVLVDLNRCADLAYVRKEGDRLRIGAMTRQIDAQTSALVRAECPMLAAALAHAGPLTIRNRATVGGSLANGYPLAQLPCVAVCLDAELVLQGPRGVRRVPAVEFFVTAMVTALEPGELLREVSLPCAGRATQHVFRESGNHAGGSALAVVCVRADLAGGKVAEAAVAASGVAPAPVRLREVERQLGARGKQADLAAALAHDVPVQGYARSLAAALLEDAVKAL